jgi:hypothetical protein
MFICKGAIVMEMSAQEICSWFEANIEKSIWIEKEEQTDLDRIELEVQEVGFLEHAEGEDPYIPNQAIVLHGVGTIQNQEGEKQRLPKDYFEIPLDRSVKGVESNNGLEIQTERAHYSIKINS